jgi:hypothetical protein
MFDFGSVERRLNGFTREWRAVQSGSLKTVNTVLGLISKLHLVKSKQFYEHLDNFPDLNDRLVLSILDQINAKIPELQKTVYDFNKLLEKVDSWSQVCSKLIQSEIKTAFLSQKEDSIDEIRLMEQTLQHMQEIVTMFEMEVHLRQKILDILKYNKSELNAQYWNFYMVVWSIEPYIDFNRINELLESLQDLSVPESDIKSQI